jgi:hypothetical protein
MHVGRKIMAGLITRNLVCKLVFLMLLQAGLLSAQTVPNEPTDQQEEDVTAPQNADEEVPSRLPRQGRSLKDSVTQDIRNKAGFSLGLYGLYDSAPATKSGEQIDKRVEGMVLPMVFANIGKKTTVLHLDYSMERRVFTNTDVDTTFHMGNFGLTYSPSRKLVIDLSDEARSAPSNLLSLTGGFRPGLPGGNPLGPGISAYSFERLLMNNATGRLSYQFTDNNAISFYGNSQIFRYEVSSSQDMNPYNIGASFAHSFSRNLDGAVEFLAGNYDTLSGSRRERIKRLSGGFDYQMTRRWSVRGSAGVEWVDIQGAQYTPTYFEAGIGRVSRKSIFAISYRRGAQYQLGTTLLTANHTASASLDQRLSKRSSIYISGNYYRSNPFALSSQQTTFISGLGFKYLLFSHLLASINGNYLHQNRAFVEQPSPILNRYIIYAGLEIMLPGVHSNDRKQQRK